MKETDLSCDYSCNLLTTFGVQPRADLQISPEPFGTGDNRHLTQRSKLSQAGRLRRTARNSKATRFSLTRDQWRLFLLGKVYKDNWVDAEAKRIWRATIKPRLNLFERKLRLAIADKEDLDPDQLETRLIWLIIQNNRNVKVRKDIPLTEWPLSNLLSPNGVRGDIGFNLEREAPEISSLNDKPANLLRLRVQDSYLESLSNQSDIFVAPNDEAKLSANACFYEPDKAYSPELITKKAARDSLPETTAGINHSTCKPFERVAQISSFFSLLNHEGIKREDLTTAGHLFEEKGSQGSIEPLEGLALDQGIRNQTSNAKDAAELRDSAAFDNIERCEISKALWNRINHS